MAWLGTARSIPLCTRYIARGDEASWLWLVAFLFFKFGNIMKCIEKEDPFIIPGNGRACCTLLFTVPLVKNRIDSTKYIRSY